MLPLFRAAGHDTLLSRYPCAVLPVHTDVCVCVCRGEFIRRLCEALCSVAKAPFLVTVLLFRVFSYLGDWYKYEGCVCFCVNYEAFILVSVCFQGES